jgi:hypothetical protein
MALPNFLGIGAQRSGTTWLYTLLGSHPDIYVPKQQKEIHFFDEHYIAGIDWYERFFPLPVHASKYRAIGEVTPAYLYYPSVPERIKQHIPECRFIAILRNPVERAYSQYGLAVRNQNEKRSFRDYLEQTNAYARGLYSVQLKRYLQYFPAQNFLILIFEKAFNDPAPALRRIADFLCVDADRFSYRDASRKVHSSYQVRLVRSYAIYRRLARYLRRKDADRVVNLANAFGVRRLFGNRGMLPPMDDRIRTELHSRYQADIAVLEDLLGEDLSLWRRK